MPKNIHFEQTDPEPYSGQGQDVDIRYMSNESSSVTIKYGHAEYLSDDTDWCRFRGFNSDIALSTVTSSAAANTSAVIGLVLRANLTGVARSVKFDIGSWDLNTTSGEYTNEDIWDTVTITQNPLPVCMVKEDMILSKEQHVGKISVICDSDHKTAQWSISSDVSWIRITDSLGTGDSINVTSYTVLENTEGTRRVGYVKISVSDEVTYSFKVTQEVSSSIIKPSISVSGEKLYIFEHYQDTEVKVDVSDPQGWGWLVSGYTKGVIFNGALNPNNSDLAIYQNIEFSTHNVDNLVVTGTPKKMDGTGDMQIRVLFPKNYTGRAYDQTLKLFDTSGDEIDSITFSASDAAKSEYLVENPPQEVIWPTGSKITSLSYCSVDVGEPWPSLVLPEPIPSNAKRTCHVGVLSTSIIGWYKGRLGKQPLGLRAGVTAFYTYATREDGSKTPYSYYPAVVWDKDNLMQDIQFESHKTISLSAGESAEVALIKKPGCGANASNILLSPVNPTMYSIVTRDSGDKIILTVTAKTTKGGSWIWANYGGSYDFIRLSCGGGTQIKQDTSIGGWLWNNYLLADDLGSLAPRGGLTLEEGDRSVIYDTAGTADGTHVHGADMYHLVIKGDADAISVGDIVRNPNSSESTAYMFSVEAIKPGLACIDLVYDNNNSVKRHYSVLVKPSGTTEIKSIGIKSSTKKLLSGKSYDIFYNIVPKTYNIFDSSGKLRSDVSVYSEVDDPNNCVSSKTVVYDGNGTYHISISTNFNVSGQIGVRFGLRDSINDALSPTMVFNASPSLSLPQQSDITLTETSLSVDYSLIKSLNLSEYVSAPADSYYYFKVDSSKSNIAYIGSDGMTLIIKNIGTVEARLYAHYQISSDSSVYDSPQDTGKSISITISDVSGVDADALNIRFKVRSIEFDRSLEIFRKFNGNYSDNQEQLYKKYGVYNVRDLIIYDDPDKIFDNKRLVLSYENERGEEITTPDVSGYYVKNCWEEGTYYACVYYGYVSGGTKMILRDRIPVNVITSNPNRVFFRSTNTEILIPDATEYDFTRWYSPSYFWRGHVIPIDANVFSKWEWGESSYPYKARSGEVLQYWEYNPSGKTLDERYRFRISGYGLQGGYNTLHTHFVKIAPLGTHIHYPDPDGDVRGLALPKSIKLSSVKSWIAKGECLYIKVSYTPELDFGMGFWYFTVDGKTEYDIHMGFYDYGQGPKITAIEVIAATRHGLIIRGGPQTGSHTVRISYKEKDGKTVAGTITISVSDTYYTAPSGELIINAQKNSDETIKDNQTISLSGGNITGWATSDWGTVSVTNSGLVRTYKPGSATLYAVTTDGRLAMLECTAQERPEPVITTTVQQEESEPSAPIDTTVHSATKTDWVVDIHFENTSPVIFESSESSPIFRSVLRGDTTIDISQVQFYSSDPGVISVLREYNASEKTIAAKITPVGRGSARVYFTYGGYSNYLNVIVNSGEEVSKSYKLSYLESRGATLSPYEYTTIRFGVSGDSISDSDINLISSSSGIIVEKTNPFISSGIATMKVTSTSKISGTVSARCGDEELVFSIVNRYNLEFENIKGFVLGKGATRNILLYPLDNLIRLSEVSVTSENENVSIGRITESKDKDGKRVFLVPITYLQSGHDTLIAHRAGDRNDIYLEFDCEAKSVKATSIRFNTDSINIEL